MYKVIIWGMGYEYNRHYNLIKYYEQMGEIAVRAVFSNDKIDSATLDGFPICSKDLIKTMEYDLCLVAIADLHSVMLEAKELGILLEQLIPIKMLEIPYFSFEKYLKVKNSNITILSNTCWAGLCYHYLGLEFQSPTINMFFEGSQFIKFVANLDYYLSVPVEFVETRYDINLKKEYPVAKIDDIRLHFNHYICFEEAKECWERRKKRINIDNIFVVYSSTSADDMVEFNKLKYNHKLMFIPDEVEPETEFNFPVSYTNKGDGVSFGMYANRFANGIISTFDLLSLLIKKDFIRKK